MAGRYTFPLDDQQRNKAWLKFETYEQVPPSFDTSKGEASNSTDGAAGNSLPTYDQVASAELQNARSIKQSDSVLLYLPPSLQIADGVQLDNVDLGFLGAVGENALNNGASLGAAAKATAAAGVGSLADMFKGEISQDAARAVGSRFAGGMGGATAGAVQSALKTAPNPNTRALFKSVNLREFSFDFKMLPKSEAEAEQVKRIIHYFRKNLYPKTIKMANTGIPIAYKFPNQFQITALYDGKPLSNDIRFERMYLRVVQTNYNPQQQSFYKGGHFQEINMALTFIEARALTYEDIIKQWDWNNDGLNSNTF